MSGDAAPVHAASGETASGAAAAGPAWPWALGAIFFFVAMIVVIRMLAGRIPAGDMAFYRTAFGLLLMLPFLLGGGAGRVRQRLKTRRLGLYLLRAALTYGAVVSWFYAVTKIPLAEAIALNTTIPIFTTALAVVLLGERVGLVRWASVAAGFAGALVMLRPGFAEISLAALAALGSAVLYAGAGICVKLLARTEPAGRIVFYMNLLVAIAAAGPFVVEGVAPRWADLPLILAVGGAGTLAHYCQSNAMKRADASFVAPFDFLRLPLGAVAGYALFADRVDPWIWPGASLVFAGVLILARAEARRH
jgi:drug/metabolite transporter (DMT)-like permease